jgi:hypothetical protein
VCSVGEMFDVDISGEAIIRVLSAATAARNSRESGRTSAARSVIP